MRDSFLLTRGGIRNSPVLIFGEFELDAARYELRKRGRRVKLQRIPMELLLLIAGRKGESVLRADLLRVWESQDPDDAERSINTAVRKIRQAQGDDAGRPRFVETVPGKGYRFIAEVSESAWEPASGPVPAPGDSDSRVPLPEAGGPARGRRVDFPWYAVAVLGRRASEPRCGWELRRRLRQ